MLSEGVMYTNIVDYTLSGHVVGMLDRDQRTAKLRCNAYHQSAMYSVLHTQNYVCYECTRSYSYKNKKIVYRQHPYRDYSHNRRSRRTSYLWNTFRRLHQALITGIYLLSLVSVPCSLSAPTKMGDLTDSSQSFPKWVNPCDINVDAVIDDVNVEGPTVSELDQQLASIISQAYAAFTGADQFKESYAQTIFNTNFEKLHENWKSSRYEWLPNQCQIPKSLNDNVPIEHLTSLKLDNALLDTYHYLQMIAVGLEQVVRDQEREDGAFLQNFTKSENQLRLVLCEIQTLIYNRGIHNQMRPDVARDIMPDYLRNETDQTLRNLRDWIIYREYMNALEYVIQVFDYFKSKL